MEAKRDPTLGEIVTSILESYREHEHLSHLRGGSLPNREIVWGIVEDLLRILFPGFLERSELSPQEVTEQTAERVLSVERRLRGEIEKGLRSREGPATPDEELRQRAESVALNLLGRIPAIRDLLARDIEAAYDGDPAARSMDEIVVAYPGLQAIAVYRIAHGLYQEDIPMVPRMMSEYAHSRTGIDIHPGATIGERFFIDHGTGVVIGETSTIGENVKIYQSVTLGARSFPRDEEGRVIKGIKRHPDIEDAVTIYSGATVLGDIRIGKGSVIGGNVWLTHGIPEDTRIIVRPPQQVHIDRGISDFQI